MTALAVDASAAQTRRLRVRLAAAEDRHQIYSIRHDVYAQELGQHACNERLELRDSLDAFNEYIVVADGDSIAGFLSITPPGGGRYSLDKYLPRTEWPFPVEQGLFELRLLTVVAAERTGPIAMLLMHAARRYLEDRAAQRVMAIGRRDVLDMYLKIGLRSHRIRFPSGAVEYELLSAELSHIVDRVRKFDGALSRISMQVDWALPYPFADDVQLDQTPARNAGCRHGGAFFEAIGTDFACLARRHEIINADVLDAWFPPAPGVLSELQSHLEWMLRTSPPTDCSGLVQEVARARGVPESCLAPGAGSSDLVFRACLRWLTPQSRVLLLDPTYGEYAHLLQHVVRCRVDRLRLRGERDYDVDLDELAERSERGYDLVVIVNPNNPTGQHVPRDDLQRVLASAPAHTRFWIDEAYVDYVGADESVEQFAAASDNVVVCKSMSKAYALSGARVAYLCGPPETIRDLRAITPPWVVGLPAQIAAVRALQDPDYYESRYAETRVLREQLSAELQVLGLEVLPGAANFLLCRSMNTTAEALIERCRSSGLFLRDVSSMMTRPEFGLFRIAVKDARTNSRMVAILHDVLSAR